MKEKPRKKIRKTKTIAPGKAGKTLLDNKKALSELSSYNRSLIEASLDPLVTIDHNGKITDVNAATETATGLVRKELIGTSFSDYFSDPEKARAGYQRVLKEGTVRNYPLEIRHRDGHLTPVIYNASVYKDEAGRAAGVFAAARDITERRKAEERINHLNLVLRSIRDVNQLITKETDRNKLIKGACDNLIANRGYYSAWISLFDADGRLLATAEAGMGDAFKPIAELLKRGELPNCARQSRKIQGIITIKDAHNECTDCPIAKNHQGRGAMSLRLESGGKLYGHLCISIPIDLIADKEEQSLFNEVANDIAFALRNIEIEEGRKQAEEALRESEETYRALAENANDGIFITVGKGVQAYANKRAAEITGYSESELLTTGIKDLVHPDELKKIMERYRKRLEGDYVPAQYETIIIRKNGKSVPIELTAAKTVWQGQPADLVIIRDITERRRMEEALRESEERYRTTMMSVGDGVIATDIEGRVELLNPVTEALTGWKQEEARGKPLEEIFRIINEETRQTVENPVRRVMREGMVVGLANHSVLIAKDGTEHPIADSGAPIRNEKGKISGVVLVFRDQTQERNAQKALKESEERYRRTIVDLAVGFYSMTLDGKLLDHNTEFNRIFGFGSDENLAGIRLPDFWQDPEERKAYVEELQKHGIIKSYPISAKKTSGEHIFIEANTRLVKDRRGQPTHIEGTFVNVTERKQAEEEIRKLNAGLEERVRERTVQLETANRELEAFSYSVSHDLRAPLRAIDGFSKVLLDNYSSKLEEDAKRYLNIVRNNTQQMGKLIDDLLSFSRIGKQEMRLSQINMEILADESFDQIKADLPNRIIHFKNESPSVAFGDINMMKIVLTNLFSNAAKFTGQKSEAVIAFGGKNENNENIFYVKDNGVGFDMKYANKLFGVFQRLHNKDEYEGTGVGLALVQRVIHRHGGRVWAEGKVNEGAAFYFSLPIKEAMHD